MSLCKYDYMQPLYSPLQCLNLFFDHLFPCIHNAAEDTTYSPNWHPKSPLFTPMSVHLKILSIVCILYRMAANKFLEGAVSNLNTLSHP